MHGAFPRELLNASLLTVLAALDVSCPFAFCVMSAAVRRRSSSSARDRRFVYRATDQLQMPDIACHFTRQPVVFRCLAHHHPFYRALPKNHYSSLPAPRGLPVCLRCHEFAISCKFSPPSPFSLSLSLCLSLAHSQSVRLPLSHRSAPAECTVGRLLCTHVPRRGR